MSTIKTHLKIVPKHGTGWALWQCNCCNQQMCRNLGGRIWIKSYCEGSGKMTRLYRVSAVDNFAYAPKVKRTAAQKRLSILLCRAHLQGKYNMDWDSDGTKKTAASLDACFERDRVTNTNNEAGFDCAVNEFLRSINQL